LFNAPKILIIDADLTVCSTIKLLLKRQDFEVDSISFPKIALKTIERFEADLILLDMNFEIEIEDILSAQRNVGLMLMAEWTSLPDAMEAMKKGATSFISKSFKKEQLISKIQIHLSLRQLNTEPLTRMERMTIQHIVGKESSFLEALNFSKKVAKINANALISGESGTGKTLIAEMIFDENQKAKQTLEIFDGDKIKQNDLESVNGNTILLEQIHKMSPAKQEMVSRYLFEQQSDLRILGTTTQNLKALCEKGDFRKDLFFHINTVQVEIPSLEQRIDDIPLLAKSFLDNLKKLFQLSNLRVDGFAIHWLQQQTFKGNIPQLKKLVERVALMSFDGKITADDFKNEFQNSIKNAPLFMPEVGELTNDQVEILMIKKALQVHKNEIGAAANSLGLTRSGLSRKMGKYGIG